MSVDRPTPEQMAHIIENGTYRNRKAQEEAEWRFQSTCHRFLAGYVGFLEKQIDAHVLKADELGDRMSALGTKLERLTSAARRGEDFDLENAVALDKEAAALLSLAQAMPDRVASLVESASDPFKSWSDAFAKYPALQRPDFCADPR